MNKTKNRDYITFFYRLSYFARFRVNDLKLSQNNQFHQRRFLRQSLLTGL